MRKFEYMTIALGATGWFASGKIDFDHLTERLNELGREGWELVTAEDTTGVHGVTRDLALFLKREIEQETASKIAPYE